MAERNFDLAPAELEVLRVLWDEAPCTVRGVLNALHERGRRVAYTTVLTFLTRMEQKGCVRSDKSGQAYVYRPLISRAEVSRSRLRALLEQLYDGSAGSLALQLVKHEKLTRDEISELHALIERLDGKERKPGKPAS